MKPSHFEEKVTRVNMELLSLKEDLKKVMTPTIRRYIENEIFQKENKLSLLMKKHINENLAQTPAIQPLSEKETQPCQTRKVIRRSGSK
jgi:hypothetical protein